MSDPIPLNVAGLLPSPGVYGRTLSGAGTGKILSAAEIRAAAEAYSAAQVDAALALRVPYTGANAAVNLGTNALTCGAINAAGDILPSSHNTRNLGSSAVRFMTGFFSSGVTAAGQSNFATIAGASLSLSGAMTTNLAIRNGLNPMQAELFGTYTSATSFESLCLKATATAHQIGSAIGSGGGTNRPVQLGHFNSAGVFSPVVRVETFSGVTFRSSTADVSQISSTTSAGNGTYTLSVNRSTFGLTAADVITATDAGISTRTHNLGNSGNCTFTLGGNASFFVGSSGSEVLHCYFNGASVRRAGMCRAAVVGVALAVGQPATTDINLRLQQISSATGDFLQLTNAAGVHVIRAMASGQLNWTPPSSASLSVNGHFSIEMTSNTAGNLVYRGSDGTTRRMALTFV